MSIIKQFSNKELLVSVWKMEESEETLYELLGSSSEKTREECNQRFFGDARKKEWLSVRVLLSQLLGKSVSVGYRANGEPFLIGSKNKVSISHTRGYVAVAIGFKSYVGIDVELFSHRVDAITHKIMVPTEMSSNELDSESKTWYSLLVWSIKESVYKCLDIDFLDYKKGILVHPFNLLDEGETKVEYSNCNYHYPLYAHYLCTEDYVLTWCSEFGVGCL